MSRRETARLLKADTAVETSCEAPALSLASGDERPVRSPALELQEALQEMLAARVEQPAQPAAALALGIGLIGVTGVCAAFWIAVGQVLIAVV